jgi:ABC-type spermidine/putrescine transport system permease subunit II
MQELVSTGPEPAMGRIVMRLSISLKLFHTLDLAQALFKAGRRSLIIGIVILAICLAVGWLASLMLGDGPLPE